jgi:hypothetical protein
MCQITEDAANHPIDRGARQTTFIRYESSFARAKPIDLRSQAAYTLCTLHYPTKKNQTSAPSDRQNLLLFRQQKGQLEACLNSCKKAILSSVRVFLFKERITTD